MITSFKSEPTIFEKSKIGRKAFEFESSLKNDLSALPKEFIRKSKANLPELSEVDIVRHFTNLSLKNFGVDSGFYPLGSCTMKYNPKINEYIASNNSFLNSHPNYPLQINQGSLEIIYHLNKFLCEITGMDAASSQPAAGAHGELAGMLMIRTYHNSKGQNRTKVIVPNSAHGTNPSSAHLANFKVKEIKCNDKGLISAEDVAKIMDEDTAGIMITNPNTLGLFETEISKISEIVHQKDGLVYLDGANFNALIGKYLIKPMGVDILHLNLHKTFSTPHGGGGPGSGPICVANKLADFLPVPQVNYTDGKYYLDYDLKNSIGKISTYYGNFGVMLKALAYILTLGKEDIAKVSETAVLSANYIKENLKKYYHLPFNSGPCMHECVFTDKIQNEKGVKTLDIAKRLMDYGFHPPTVYFPLVVHGAIMIEPTETESKETLDAYIDAMKKIAIEAKENPELVKNAPQRTVVKRLDEVKAAKEPKLKWG